MFHIIVFSGPSGALVWQLGQRIARVGGVSALIAGLSRRYCVVIAGEGVLIA